MGILETWGEGGFFQEYLHLIRQILTVLPDWDHFKLTAGLKFFRSPK